jgi:DNA-binding PadR family transcriptional regulator
VSRLPQTIITLLRRHLLLSHRKPALLKMEQEGSIVSHWGVSENNRKAKFYQLTRAGRKQLEKEARDWEQTTAILARFLTGDMS